MSRKWRVGVLGLGHWYSAYGLGRDLATYPAAELTAAAWTDPGQLDEFCSTFEIKGYDSYEALLEREDVDIVQISAPVSDIPRCAIAAAKAGKHIVLGKPMAMTLAEADEIVRAVEDAGVVCVPFQSLMRFQYAAMKDRIATGEIGDILLLHTTCRWSIAEDWYRSGRPGWFVDPAYVPGGALIDEGIYWIDLVEWLADSHVRTVEARTANLVHRDLDVEDWGMATFELDNGVIATMEASWTINSPAATAPSPKQNSVVRLEVVGSRGEIMDQWFRDPGRAVLGAGAANWTFERDAQAPFGPPTPPLIAHVIDCVENGRDPIATVHDARQAFAAAMAAYDAARSGSPAPVSR